MSNLIGWQRVDGWAGGPHAPNGTPEDDENVIFAIPQLVRLWRGMTGESSTLVRQLKSRKAGLCLSALEQGEYASTRNPAMRSSPLCDGCGVPSRRREGKVLSPRSILAGEVR